MRRSIGLSVLVLVLAGGASGQTVTVGNLPPNPNFGFMPSAVPVTAIDLSSPSPSAATLTSAAFTWQASPCPATVKVKFFRPSPTGAFVFLTERGPYDVTSLTQFVFLSPPVAVQPGDLVGIARIGSCGTPVGQTPGNAAGFIAFGTDVTFTVTASQGTLFPN